MLFFRHENNPVIIPDYRKKYEKECTYNPSAVKKDGKIFLIYRAEGKYGEYISRLCLAESSDGVHFKKYNRNPIINPSRPEEKRGCEDPRITKIRDTYYMTYTAYEGIKKKSKHKIALSLATSKDLIHWKKLGIIMKGEKAGYIYPEKIGGNYLMFFGEGLIKIAESKDLKNWKVVNPSWLKPRRGKFDSKIVEVGPPPVKIGDQLFFIYNSSDNYKRYSPSFLILDAKDPTKILYRHDEPILFPEEQFELFGKVNNVIFAEGLVEIKNKCFLYYGAADKCIGLAIADKRNIEKTCRKLTN
ncbi:MAG: glycosidase [Candidatus Aenigmarchaeota archaeon]|nr:glycosidase [Candidatus Aenigmarchaeota archaeon]